MILNEPVLASIVEQPLQRPNLYVSVDRIPFDKSQEAYHTRNAVSEPLIGNANEIIFLLPGTVRLAEIQRREEALKKLGTVLHNYMYEGDSDDDELIRVAREAGVLKEMKNG